MIKIIFYSYVADIQNIISCFWSKNRLFSAYFYSKKRLWNI